MGESGPVLMIYVVWHPASEEASSLAETIFTTLCTDPEYPARRGLGIPVRFRTSTTPSEVPAPLSFGDSDRTAVVLLMDANLVVDPRWRRYVTTIIETARDNLVIPVTLIAPEHLPAELAQLRTMPLAEIEPNNRPAELLNRVMHDVALYLDRESRGVKVFLSYARTDGLSIAKSVRRHLHEVAGLDDFFDAADLPFGSRIAKEITEAAGTALALLAIQTDSYASREWCRREVLEAKRQRVPIVVMTAVQHGEHRSFPYLGNAPVVRWNGESSLNHVVTAILREVLRTRYFPRRVKALCQLHDLDPDREVFAHPPELLTALMHRIDLSKAGQVVGRYLYPDPPLGVEELNLIQMIDPGLRPVTPTTLWAS